MIDYRATAIKQLTEHNIRPSLQRIAIYEYLLEKRSHPTVEEIHSALCPSIPTLSKTTVYNVLKNLVENKIVLSLNIDDKNMRYDADISDHTHLKCEVCKRLFDIPQPKFIGGELECYKINKVHIYCWGICPECHSKIENKAVI